MFLVLFLTLHFEHVTHPPVNVNINICPCTSAITPTVSSDQLLSYVYYNVFKSTSTQEAKRGFDKSMCFFILS